MVALVFLLIFFSRSYDSEGSEYLVGGKKYVSDLIALILIEKED